MTVLITGGMIFGPWISLSMATFQETVPPVLLSQVLAVRGSGRGNCRFRRSHSPAQPLQSQREER
jgi:hypothetical protein